jgi:energy-coupling factor transport system substrate-specific component
MKQKAVLKQKKKSKKKEVVVVEKESASAQKVALHALQKQIQVLNLKEWLVLIGVVFGGALLRIPMQAVPSAEPLTFFAVLAGWMFGKKKGFLVGASSLYISNFFMFGGQGPWTIFQAAAFGIAGFLGGFLRKKARIMETLVIVAIGTLVFELIMNLSSAIFLPFSILTLFFTAIPFMFTHLISNSIFALFLPKAKELVFEKGKFNEREICEKALEKYKNSKIYKLTNKR